MTKIEILSDGRAVMGDKIYPSANAANVASRNDLGRQTIVTLIDANIPYYDNKEMVENFIFEYAEDLKTALGYFLEK